MSPGSSEGRRITIEPGVHGAAEGDKAWGQQTAEPRVVGRQRGTQVAVSIHQTVTMSQDRTGDGVGLYDLPPPVHTDHADHGVVDHSRKGRVQRSRAGKCLADPDELANVGQQALDHLDLIGSPAMGSVGPAGDGQQLRGGNPTRLLDQHRCCPPAGFIQRRGVQRLDNAIETVQLAHDACRSTRTPCARDDAQLTASVRTAGLKL